MKKIAFAIRANWMRTKIGVIDIQRAGRPIVRSLIQSTFQEPLCLNVVINCGKAIRRPTKMGNIDMNNQRFVELKAVKVVEYNCFKYL
jgi:hypothetical protein